MHSENLPYKLVFFFNSKHFDRWHIVWKWQKKVSFNIVSEASYFDILSGPKMFQFGEFLKAWSLRLCSFTWQVIFNWTKIGGKCQIWKMVYLTSFSKPESCSLAVSQCYLIGHFQKLHGKCQNSKLQMRHFKRILNTVGQY